jgi:hypothetical protein
MIMIKSKTEKLETVFAMPKDFMACRKVNTAPKIKPNINIDDIESFGISLEALDACNVPVYRYKTQITLHGIWPETQGYCFGYKHIVRNGNGSIGIRYGAIDGEKKSILRHISHFTDFGCYFNSTETGFFKSYKDKDEAISSFQTLKAKTAGLFVGSVNLLHDKFLTCRYYVDFTVSAVPQKTFWRFSEALFDISEARLAEIETAEAQKEAADEAKRQAKLAIEKKQQQAAKAQAKMIIEQHGLKPFTPNGKDFRGISPSYGYDYNNGDYTYYPSFQLIEVKRKAFGACYKTIGSTSLDKVLQYQFDWTKKAHRYENKYTMLYA